MVGELIAGALSDEPGYSAIHVLTPALALETIKHAVLFETGSGAESVGEFRRCGIASYVAKPFNLWTWSAA